MRFVNDETNFTTLPGVTARADSSEGMHLYPVLPQQSVS